ncbi:MAG: hypothetical protein GX946_06105 [Oligosphaeraceae bacterium]|nr:hypothetical protein [Oligosphaeraceae bacterium]
MQFYFAAQIDKYLSWFPKFQANPPNFGLGSGVNGGLYNSIALLYSRKISHVSLGLG